MKMLGKITTKQTAHEARMDISSHVVIPVMAADAQPGPKHYNAERGHPMVAVQDDQDQFHGTGEQVQCRITHYLRGAS